MPALAISPQDQANTLVTIAGKYNIPVSALLGIYGQETGFGSDVKNSTAGAVGPFQFIPSTAAAYGYPQTNTPSLAQFYQQADAWGRYLVANNPSRDPNGWAPAMRGGYDQAQANSNLTKIPASLLSALKKAQPIHALGGGGTIDFSGVPGLSGVQAIVGAAGAIPGLNLPSPLGPIEDLANIFAKVFTFLTTPASWLRILEFIAGAVAIFYGLAQLSGADKKVTQIVTTAARTAR